MATRERISFFRVKHFANKKNKQKISAHKIIEDTKTMLVASVRSRAWDNELGEPHTKRLVPLATLEKNQQSDKTQNSGNKTQRPPKEPKQAHLDMKAAI